MFDRMNFGTKDAKDTKLPIQEQAFFVLFVLFVSFVVNVFSVGTKP